MRRRDFIAGLGGAVAMPYVAHAQDKVRRLAVLMNVAEHDPEGILRLVDVLSGTGAAVEVVEGQQARLAPGIGRASLGGRDDLASGGYA